MKLMAFSKEPSSSSEQTAMAVQKVVCISYFYVLQVNLFNALCQLPLNSTKICQCL